MITASSKKAENNVKWKNKGKEISVIKVNAQNEFLDVGSGVRYKFDNSIISYLQKIRVL
ncbi:MULTISPECIES: hypothetical protein [unclassified Wolbachia]|uniref:hypothetical protein n=1 Tax=unclassified Wolbachia TaxID=2640676 RepID=UPI000303ED1E|nr:MULTISPECIES: hypothetical protein [unclassified Wolbachia]